MEYCKGNGSNSSRHPNNEWRKTDSQWTFSTNKINFQRKLFKIIKSNDRNIKWWLNLVNSMYLKIISHQKHSTLFTEESFFLNIYFKFQWKFLFIFQFSELTFNNFFNFITKVYNVLRSAIADCVSSNFPIAGNLTGASLNSIIFIVHFYGIKFVCKKWYEISFYTGWILLKFHCA